MTPADKEKSTRASRLLWLALVLLLAWQVVGVWPAAPVEGDGEAIAAGAESLAAHDPGAAAACYRHAGQVGTYALLSWGRSLLGLPCASTFAALSALAGLAFVLLAARLLRLVLGVALPAAGVALLLFQETAAEAFYANSTVLAAAFLMLACVVAASGEGGPARTAASGLALGVAGLLRADVVLVAPVLPLLLHRGEWRRTLSQASLCAIAAAATYSAVSLALGAGPGAAAREAVSHMGGTAAASLEVPGWLGNEGVRSAVAFFSPAWVVAVALGGVAAVRRRRWRLVLVAGVGALPLALAYARNLSSPKYLYYAIPFLVLLALSGVRETGRGWRCATAVVAALLVVQQLLGLRITIRTKPWIVPPGDALVLGGRQFENGLLERVDLVVGSGTIVPTADGLRLSSGLAFAPLAWHRAKKSTDACRQRLRELLDGPDPAPAELFSGSWLAANAVDVVLREAGFTPVGEARLPLAYGHRRTWQRGGRRVVHTSCEVYSYQWKDHAWALSHATFPRVLYVAGGGRERAMTLEHAAATLVCDDDGATCLALLDLDVAATLARPAADPLQRLANTTAPGPS